MTVFPDKWVRKAIKEALDSLTIGSSNVPVFDVNTLSYTGKEYLILGTQSAIPNNNKCKNGWDCTIVVEAFTRMRRNSGSRVHVDDMIQAVLTATENLQLDPLSDLRIQNIHHEILNSITAKTTNEIVHRKFIRFELNIE